jgi:hypothetical protein
MYEWKEGYTDRRTYYRTDCGRNGQSYGQRDGGRAATEGWRVGCERGIYWREGLKDVFEVWIRGMDLKVGMERSIGRMD